MFHLFHKYKEYVYITKTNTWDVVIAKKCTICGKKQNLYTVGCTINPSWTSVTNHLTGENLGSEITI